LVRVKSNSIAQLVKLNRGLSLIRERWTW